MPRITSVFTNVAHLVGPGKLKVINGQLAFSAKDQQAVRLHPKGLRMVFCYGPVGGTDEALQVLLRHEVELAWLSLAGQRCRGRLARAEASAAPLRLCQYKRFTDDDWRCQFATALVAAKINSQIAAARHYQRHSGPAAGDVLRYLQKVLVQCEQTVDLNQIRGYEGTATAAWFKYFGQILRTPWTFPRRVRRPPTDPVNALLSLGYTFLLTRTVARCEAHGLEVYLGTLHEYRSGRPSLACDLMEPLRVPAVDRWVIEICNTGLVDAKHFVGGSEGVRLQPAAFARVIQSWEDHWLNGGHEKTLDTLLDELVLQLRGGPAPATVLLRKADKPELETNRQNII